MECQKKLVAYEEMLAGYNDSLKKATTYECASDQLRKDKIKLETDIMSTTSEVQKVCHQNMEMRNQIVAHKTALLEKEEELQMMAKELYELKKATPYYVPVKV